MNKTLAGRIRQTIEIRDTDLVAGPDSAKCDKGAPVHPAKAEARNPRRNELKQHYGAPRPESGGLQTESGNWFAASPMALLAVTKEGRISRANDAAQIVLRSKKTLVGQKIKELFEVGDGLSFAGWTPFLQLPIKMNITAQCPAPRRPRLCNISVQPIIGGLLSGQYLLHLWPTAMPLAENGEAPGTQVAGNLDTEPEIPLSVLEIHDLKAPLRHISAALRFLEADQAGKVMAEDADWLSIAREQTGSLQEMVMLILENAKRRYAQLEPQAVALPGFFQKTLKSMAVALREAGAEVRLELDLVVIRADPLCLRLLLENLIGNALQNRHPLRPSRITIRSGTRQNGFGFLQVADNGMGFDENRSEEIFEPFRQLKKEEATGFGLGLASCKKICSRHGWEIVAEGRPSHGATFTVVLSQEALGN
ncbi:PAS domain-containing sensor histidine kinase [Algicella marina]|uniref:histidine kinase n=1 Tax=Algicella marina TaxID=2683284 RepID=A0A6P1T5V7_9RHOB|nr:PAS domain-containing sensor histidine kinase [Algicella marina]QHQ35942.1 hypothetical protein GO499_12565 [Algicella marina]